MDYNWKSPLVAHNGNSHQLASISRGGGSGGGLDGCMKDRWICQWMDDSPVFVKAHVGMGCNKGLMQATLTAASFLERTVYISREIPIGNLLFIYTFLKSPLVIIREQVWYLKEEWSVKGSKVR